MSGIVALWLIPVGLLTLAVNAFGLARRAMAAGILAAVFVIGTTAQLALTQPLWITFFDINPHSNAHRILVGLVGLQGLAALVGLGAAGIGQGVAVVRRLGVVRCLAFLALTLAVSASGWFMIRSGTLVAAVKQVAVAVLFVGVNLTTLAAFARRLPVEALASASAWIEARVSLPGAAPRVRPLDALVPWLGAGIVLASSLLVALGVFERSAHLEDEVIYLFQARTFLTGALWAPAPPAAAQSALEYYMLSVEHGRWFAVTMPGWPAVLALGVAIGAPWLVNPLLAAASVPLLHALARRWMSVGLANVAVLLMATSPWLRTMGGTMMPHLISVVATLGAWLAVTASLKATKPARAVGPALLAGLLLGLLFLTRPFEGVLVGAMTGLWLISRGLGPVRLAAAAAYGVGCTIVGGLLFAFNLALTGNALLTPLTAYLDRAWGKGANRMGFGPDIGPPNAWGGLDLYPGHGPVEGLIYTQHNLLGLNMELFGWGAGSLALIWALLLWGRPGRTGLALLAFSGVVIVAHGFYWFASAEFNGPRYWFLILVPCVLLSAMGAAALAERLKGIGRDGGARLGAVILLSCLIGLIGFTGWRNATKYSGYNSFHADYLALAAQGPTRGALVFVQAETDNEFGAALQADDPFQRPGVTIFVRSGGPVADRAVAATYPGRTPFLAIGRSKTAIAVVVEPYDLARPGR